jgi:hypothetical protein
MAAAEQVLGGRAEVVGHARGVAEIVEGAVENNALVDVEQARGEGADGGAVVGDEQEGGFLLAVEAGEQGVELFAEGGVERGGGFVEDEQVGFGDEGAGEADALELAAGEFADHAAGDGVEIEQPEGAVDGVVVGGPEALGEVQVGGAAGGDDFADIGGEAAEGELGDLGEVADAAPVAEVGEGGVPEGDGAGAGGEQAEERAQEGGFAGAVGADDADVVAGLDGEIDGVDGGDGAVAGGKVGGAQNGHGSQPSPWRRWWRFRRMREK